MGERVKVDFHLKNDLYPSQKRKDEIKKLIGLSDGAPLQRYLKSKRNAAKKKGDEIGIKRVRKIKPEANTVKKAAAGKEDASPQTGVNKFREIKAGCGYYCFKELGAYDYSCDTCDILYHKQCLKKRPHLIFRNQKTCPNCNFSIWT